MYANLSITDFIMFPEKAAYFSKYKIRDAMTNEHDFYLSNSINANLKSLKSCSFVLVSRIVCFEK